MQIVELMPDGVVVQRGDGSICSFNPAALRVLDLTADQLLGRTSTDPEWMAVDARMQPFPGERHPAMRCIASGAPQLGVVMGVRTPSQGVRWLRIDSYPTTVDGGPGAMSLFSDITAEHNADGEARRRLRLVQEALLPRSGWTGSNVAAAAWYRAAGGRGIAGGDFYDLVDVGGASVFFIGDVSGHGVDTVAITALARYTLRAVAAQRVQPSIALGLLDECLRAEGGGHHCTAVYGIASPVDAGLEITVAVGGHPSPLIVSADGAAPMVARGPLLGAGVPNPVWGTTDFVLAAGSQLLCYTDGLTDTLRPRLDDVSLARTVQLGETPSETIERTLRALPGTWIETADDVALLVIGQRRDQRP